MEAATTDKAAPAPGRIGSIPAFDEGTGIFGSPPPHDGIEIVVCRLATASTQADPLALLRECADIADALHDEAYADALGPAIEIGINGATDYDALKGLFHRAAHVGEARLLSHIAQICLAQFERQVGAPVNA